MTLILKPANSHLTDAVSSEGWLDDQQANRDMGYGLGLEGSERAYKAFKAGIGTGTLFGVHRASDGQPVGFVVVSKPNGSEVAQFHGLVAPRFRKTIVAARVIEAIEEAVLTNGTYRLETEVLCRNTAALRLLRHLGFTQEGAHKARHRMDGKRETTMTLRILRPEWQRRQ